MGLGGGPDSASPAGDALLELQHRFGNHYVQRVVNPGQRLAVQPRLMLGDVDTPSEQQAEQVAREMAERGHLGRRPTPVRGPTTPVPPSTEQAIATARGGGDPLPEAVRTPMGEALGVDLTSVRVHTDRRADDLNDALQARAFTAGSDIFFRRGTYRPGSPEGDELLAHELTHVAQQGGAPPVVQRDWYKPLGVYYELADRETGEATRLWRQGPDDKLELDNNTWYRANAGWDSKDPADYARAEVDEQQEKEAHSQQMIRRRKNPGPASNKPKDKVTWIKMTGALFPKRLPTMGDVRQGTLGDCYLHAALASIVRQDPKTIVNMFDVDPDYPDTRIVVRLYDPDKDFEPQRISIRTTIPKKQFSKGEDWVKLIQKAFAAANFFGDLVQSVSMKDLHPGGSYRQIKGGTPEHAFEVLLGKKSEVIDIDQAVKDLYTRVANESLPSQIENATSTSAMSSPAPRSGSPFEPSMMHALQLVATNSRRNTVSGWYASTVNKSLFKQYFVSTFKQLADPSVAQALAEEWIDTLSVTSKYRSASVISKAFFPKPPSKAPTSLEGTMSMVEGFNVSKGLKSALMLWVETTGLTHSNRPESLTATERAVFERIEQSLKARQPVAAMARSGPPEEVRRRMKHRVRKDGGTEPKMGGFAFRHAYSIIGVAWTEVGGDPRLRTLSKKGIEKSQGQYVCWLKLRNPWGKIVDLLPNESYLPGFKPLIWDKQTGEFYLPMNRFFDYFKSVSFGGQT